MVDSFGVIEGGEITLNPNHKISLKGVNKQFVQGLTRPTPIAIINYRGQKIAYPISMKERGSSLIEEVTKIVESNDTLSDKTIELSKLLASNGIDPKSYNIKHIDATNSFFTSADFDRLIADISEMKESLSREEFLSKGFKKEALENVGQITVNLENNPFQSPKIQIDLKTPIRFNRQAEVEEESHFDATGNVSPSRINVIANELLSKEASELSPFNRKVLALYKKEIEKIVGKKIKLSPSKKSQSDNEKNKKC
jgi:hypothetical protein